MIDHLDLSYDSAFGAKCVVVCFTLTGEVFFDLLKGVFSSLVSHFLVNEANGGWLVVFSMAHHVILIIQICIYVYIYTQGGPFWLCLSVYKHH